ncbi:MAG: DegV family protein [Oscillospiraceae bacterium]|nr:DegV family protein [Oscillospiraceae bacterium]
MAYQIITDNCCDMEPAMYEKLGVTVINLTLLYKGAEHRNMDEPFLKELYNGMRSGEAATTSAVNPEGWASVIEPALEKGDDALVLAFSSGLSTTYQSAVIAATDLQDKYPERKILVVDTLCASLGQGLLLWYVCKKRDQGYSLEQLAEYCTELVPKLSHWFTVDDLMFLKRGGRISAATALVGTMLQIKPVLHVDDEGHLVSVAKARGRKASIEALAKKLGETGLPGENETVFICHGDCIEDAKYLENLVKEKYGVKEVYTYYTGGVIGSHSGPGTLALFFLGSQR